MSLSTNPPVAQSARSDATPSTLLVPANVALPLERLLQYVHARNYEGHDLFDGLNSRWLKRTPLYRSRLFRLALIQGCKRSPVNLRPLLGVPRGFNPKGGALFLLGHLHVLAANGEDFHANEAYLLFQRLKRLALPRAKGVGWGYNFDWQARAFYVPEGTPNLVTSVYVGRAMLAYYRRFEDPEALALALGVADFLLNEMVKFEIEDELCFNYIPGRDAEVHNANLLGAAFLAETLPVQPDSRCLELVSKIKKSVRFSIRDIQADGSWPYGTKPFHRWVDNFHTAYNIECLLQVGQSLQTDAFEPELYRVTDYYLQHLFTEDGLPKYFNHRLYPIDVHVIAEAVVVLNRLRQAGMPLNAERIGRIETRLLELISRFQDEQGYFYHQQTAQGWNKIPYIRWGQAWMFYALSTCLQNPAKSQPLGV